MEKDFVTIIMAGGLGKRMQSTTQPIPKVLHEISGMSMICHVIDKALKLGTKQILIVVGIYGNEIRAGVKKHFRDAPIEYVFQEQPMGTGHCIQCCMTYLNETYSDDINILILSGDVPLITVKTLNSLIEKKNTVLIATQTNPYGYGRVIINSSNEIEQIIEEKDCTNDQKLICDTNAGIYYITLKVLNSSIYKITNDNANNEYYLPDITKFAVLNSYHLPPERLYESHGVNTQSELQVARTIFENCS